MLKFLYILFYLAQQVNLRISVLFCRLVTVLIEVAGLLFVFGVWFWEVFRVMDTYFYGMWTMRTREVSCGEQRLSFRLVILSV